MAILRAGSWGSLTNPHANPVTDFTTVPSVYPVNCAKNNWPNQNWGALYIKNDYYFEEVSGLASLGEDVSIESDISYISFIFCYQAAQGFEINFNWAFTGAGASSNFPSLYWEYQTKNGASDSFFNTPADSGTETIMLPASTFGQVEMYVGADSFGEDVIVTASLS